MPLQCAVFPDTHNLCCYKRAVKASEQPLFLYSVHSDGVFILAGVQFLHTEKKLKRPKHLWTIIIVLVGNHTD